MTDQRNDIAKTYIMTKDLKVPLSIILHINGWC